MHRLCLMLELWPAVRGAHSAAAGEDTATLVLAMHAVTCYISERRDMGQQLNNRTMHANGAAAGQV
jgi:hypothetical protein